MAKTKSAYAQKLLDPRWQRKRLEVLDRAKWACETCGDESSPLHVHHGFYRYGTEPWDYPDSSLHCLCEACHDCADHQRRELQELSASLDFNCRDLLTELTKMMLVIHDGSRDSLLSLMCDLTHERIRNPKSQDDEIRVTVVRDL